MITIQQIRDRAAENNNWQDLIPALDEVFNRLATVETENQELREWRSHVDSVGAEKQIDDVLRRLDAVETANQELRQVPAEKQIDDVLRRLDAVETATKQLTGGGAQ